MRKKRQSYDLDFKMEVIAAAESTSNREAGRNFNIDESLVRRWRIKKKKLLEEVSRAEKDPVNPKKKNCTGKSSCSPSFGDGDDLQVRSAANILIYNWLIRFTFP